MNKAAVDAKPKERKYRDGTWYELRIQPGLITGLIVAGRMDIIEKKAKGKSIYRLYEEE